MFCELFNNNNSLGRFSYSFNAVASFANNMKCVLNTF